MFQDKIFLASQSPRRRELVSYLFDNVAILSVSYSEPESKGFAPLDYLDLCVGEKWKQALPVWKAPNNSGLLVADTMVAFQGALLGKPSGPKEAEQMLSSLSGKWHTVFTGFKLVRVADSVMNEGDVVIVDTAVKFKKLKAAEIRAYVKSGEPLDKAGAYGFQDRGLRFVSSVRGAYTNIVGLPLEKIRAECQRLGFR